MQEDLKCDICNQIIYVDEGKNPERVLLGHKIQCKLKHDKEQVQEQESEQGKPQERVEMQEPERPGQTRRKRIPFGVPQKHWNIPENDGYVYRVFNDNWRKEPGRIQRAGEAGYEIVENMPNRKPVSVNEDGTPVIGVLMRIPEEFYKEDQKAKQAELDKVDQQINRGEFTQKPGDKRYTPSGGGVKSEVKLTP